MSTIINASTSSGLIQTADTSGVLELQSNGTAAAGVSSSNFQMNSGYGSVATVYGCRAWVNFNGTGTVAIRASGNVTSITDNSTGDYTVNFTNAMPDVNYSAVALGGGGSNTAVSLSASPSVTTNSVKVVTFNSITGASVDQSQAHVAIFR